MFETMFQDCFEHQELSVVKYVHHISNRTLAIDHRGFRQAEGHMSLSITYLNQVLRWPIERHAGIRTPGASRWRSIVWIEKRQFSWFFCCTVASYMQNMSGTCPEAMSAMG